MIATNAMPGGHLPEPVRQLLSERLKAGSLEMPMLPDVAAQVVQLANDPEADMRDLARILHRDQAMAGHLLRMANSSLFAGPTPIVSLDQAVARMGLAKIRSICLTIACKGEIFQADGFSDEVRHLFKHSLAAAAFAQEIARSRRWNVEEAFLCGLLHDVGRPVLIHALVGIHKQVGIPLNTPEARAGVKQAAAALHAHVGADLISRWALPVRLVETVRYHHEPHRATTAAQTTMMTALADDLAHLLYGPKDISVEALQSHPLLDPLNIYPDEFDALLEKQEAVKQIVESLQ
jgi:putative nucleotidyltransferase with HDIG domain